MRWFSVTLAALALAGAASCRRLPIEADGKDASVDVGTPSISDAGHADVPVAPALDGPADAADANSMARTSGAETDRRSRSRATTAAAS